MPSDLKPMIDDSAHEQATAHGMPATQAAGEVTAAVRRVIDPTAIDVLVADAAEATR